ncbi:hypothetical protein [Burkholderia cepacia]|uniref:hypothetical protein n=1 Tax=Burkholderia cepacia TaxID=292 RepID=UPI002FE0781B
MLDSCNRLPTKIKKNARLGPSEVALRAAMHDRLVILSPHLPPRIEKCNQLHFSSNLAAFDTMHEHLAPEWLDHASRFYRKPTLFQKNIVSGVYHSSVTTARVMETRRSLPIRLARSPQVIDINEVI